MPCLAMPCMPWHPPTYKYAYYHGCRKIFREGAQGLRGPKVIVSGGSGETQISTKIDMFFDGMWDK